MTPVQCIIETWASGSAPVLFVSLLHFIQAWFEIIREVSPAFNEQSYILLAFGNFYIKDELNTYISMVCWGLYCLSRFLLFGRCCLCIPRLVVLFSLLKFTYQPYSNIQLYSGIVKIPSHSWIAWQYYYSLRTCLAWNLLNPVQTWHLLSRDLKMCPIWIPATSGINKQV